MKAKMCSYTGFVRWDKPGEYPESKMVDHWEATMGKLPSGIKRPRVQCPVCKRRMKANIRVCSDGCCIAFMVPRHKVKEWWKKKKKKNRKGRKNRR